MTVMKNSTTEARQIRKRQLQKRRLQMRNNQLTNLHQMEFQGHHRGDRDSQLYQQTNQTKRWPTMGNSQRVLLKTVQATANSPKKVVATYNQQAVGIHPYRKHNCRQRHHWVASQSKKPNCRSKCKILRYPIALVKSTASWVSSSRLMCLSRMIWTLCRMITTSWRKIRRERVSNLYSQRISRWIAEEALTLFGGILTARAPQMGRMHCSRWQPPRTAICRKDNNITAISTSQKQPKIDRGRHQGRRASLTTRRSRVSSSRGRLPQAWVTSGTSPRLRTRVAKTPAELKAKHSLRVAQWARVSLKGW